MITLDLPIPPSVNDLYANRKRGRGPGRYKTKEYKDWLYRADQSFLAQKWRIDYLHGPCDLHIKVPAKMRGDVDNRIKAVADYLVSRQITADDRFYRKVSIERCEYVSCCVVTVTPVGAA